MTQNDLKNRLKNRGGRNLFLGRRGEEKVKSALGQSSQDRGEKERGGVSRNYGDRLLTTHSTVKEGTPHTQP